MAEETPIIKLPEIESKIKTLDTNRDRLSSLQREILDNKQQLDFLTMDAAQDQLAKRCNELKNQGGKLGEYLKLITGASEYCSKHGCAH